MKIRSAFSLIEILLVIAILAILAAIVVTALNPTRQVARGRDQKRENDLNSISNALDNYYIDNKGYPSSIPAADSYETCGDTCEICASGTHVDAGGSCTGVNLDILVPDYLPEIPTDIDSPDDGHSGYYIYQPPGSSEPVLGAPGLDYNNPIAINDVKSLPSSIDAENASTVINGTIQMDSLGWSSSAGDINGDGYDDVVVSAHQASDDSPSYTGANRGRVYIFFGTSNPPASIDAENADIIINGTNNGDIFGGSVDSGSDVNNDGYDDLIIGARSAEDTGTLRGRVYIIYGSSSLASSIDAENADIIINGTNDNDNLGESVSTAGDVNGDGYDDILVGAWGAEDTGTLRGRVYIIYGSSSLASSIDAENADIIINGTNDSDRFGFRVRSARDLNKDGYDDVLIGAYTASDTGSQRGRAYIFYGSSNLASSIDAENANVIINGTNDSDMFTEAISSIGDINKDGFVDILIGAARAEDTGTSRGRAYIFYGSSNLASSIDAENANVIINGTNDNDLFGVSMASAGDINNDGKNDIIIGAYQAEDAGSNRGRAYLFYGASNLPALINAEDADIILNGTNDSDQFGRSVSSAGDFNLDGYSDVIVGAGAAEDIWSNGNAGRAYIFMPE